MKKSILYVFRLFPILVNLKKTFNKQLKDLYVSLHYQ